MNKPVKILDIDLDFFMDSSCRIGKRFINNREDDGILKPWSKERVRRFLNENCGLSLEKPIQGFFCKEHNQVYHELEKINPGHISEYFEIVHIDMHADLGIGYPVEYIFEELLHKPQKQRFDDKTNEGTWLLAAIACGWLSKLSYIYPDNLTPSPKGCRNNDLPMWFDEWGDCDNICLPKLEEIAANDFTTRIHERPYDDFEIEVPFRSLRKSDFEDNGNYDYIFLTQSPNYTPKVMDKLIPVIEEFMILIA